MQEQKRQHKITLDALELKEQQLLQDPTAGARASLLRTISYLKNECDVFERLHREEQERSARLQAQTREQEAESRLLREQMLEHQERFELLLRDNLGVDTLKQQLATREAQLQKLKGNNAAINQLNQELTGQLHDAQESSALEGQIKHLLEANATLEQRLQDAEHERQELIRAQYQYSNKQIVQLGQALQEAQEKLNLALLDCSQLKEERAKLQKALVAAARLGKK